MASRFPATLHWDLDNGFCPESQYTIIFSGFKLMSFRKDLAAKTMARGPDLGSGKTKEIPRVKYMRGSVLLKALILCVIFRYL